MSKYTTEVRFIVESACGLDESKGYANVNQLIDKARNKIFDFDYPIFDENYRGILERKILKHYYTREIGLETVGLWKLHLDMRLNEIMPYYNKLYESELIKIDPLYTDKLTKTGSNSKNEEREKHDTNTETESGNVKTENSEKVNSSNANDFVKNTNNIETNNKLTDYSETGSNKTANNVIENNENEKNNSLLSDSNNIHAYSDTPSGGLNGLISENYLTNASKDNTTNTNSENTTEKGNKTTNINEENSISNSSTNAENSSTDNKYTEVVNNNSNTNTEKTGNNTITNENSRINSGNAKENAKNTSEYIENIFGNTGVSQSDLLVKYRNTFLNIDMMVIENLSDLFMNLW